MQNFYHNIGFWEKRQFFRQNLSKIAENCDHNIDPVFLSHISSVTNQPIEWKSFEQQYHSLHTTKQRLLHFYYFIENITFLWKKA
jgi:hypothetical protein